MARSNFLIPLLLMAGLARLPGASGGASPRPVFDYDADSLRATLTLIGGRLPGGPDSAAGAGWRVACGRSSDSSLAAPGAWYEVSLLDKRAGTELRFPMDAAALRKGLRKACHEQGAPAPERIAAGLQALAAAMKVRMEGPESGEGE
jgi:hypothetical protein